jgi:hypothetical protein
MATQILVSLVACWTVVGGADDGQPSGVLLRVSFDQQTATADFAAGDTRMQSSAATGNLQFLPGVRGQGLLLQPGQRCEYALAQNLDTSQGTFSCWVKPLNWDGHGKKFRHTLVVTAGPQYTMLVYLYPIGDEAVLNYIHIGSGPASEATWTAGAPVDLFQREQWTHIVSTWDAQAVRLFANGRRVGEGLVAAPLPKLDTGTISICPIDFWQNKEWGDPAEQTVVDEVRIADRAMTDDEVLDLYAAEAPDGAARPAPELILELSPQYQQPVIAVVARAAHLDASSAARIGAESTLTLKVRDPNGVERFTYAGPLGQGRFTIELPEWCDGDYVAEGQLSAAGIELRGRATLANPPTPWLPAQKDWRATRVLSPWTPLARRDLAIGFWNGEVKLEGALPEQIVASGAPLLAGNVCLVADARAVWDAPRVTEDEPHRVTFAGAGTLGPFALTYTTLMEFDGLVRTDFTLTPPAAGAELPSLDLEIPLRADVATYYRNPVCRPWDGKALDELEFVPYAWLGNEERGLSWFMESAANWRRADGAPAMTLRREGDAVIVRMKLISQAVRVDRPLSYTIGFEPTPVRPLSPQLYHWRFGTGAPMRGSNLFVYGWGPQISYLNGRLIARDPDDQHRLIDNWRSRGEETLSYTCAQCTANISPEYRFFGSEWNQPYGGSFSGYKRVPDNAPYSMVPVCPASSFADFLAWCVNENIRHDWSGGIYTDIDGAIPCDNASHGCGYTDAFGQTGRSWPLYAHRGLSRRIYEACHDAHKLFFAHQHSHWYSLFNAFNDGWCPGEQYSTAVTHKPSFYMDEIPDAVWRSEFYSGTTGVATFLLPEMGRLAGDDVLQDRGPSELCMAAALIYGAPVWAGGINPRVVEEVWDAQQAFDMTGAQFIPFWKQASIRCSDPQLRVSLWQKPGAWLVVVANFTDRERTADFLPAAPGLAMQYRAAWMAEKLETAADGFKLTVPPKRGALVIATQPARPE